MRVFITGMTSSQTNEFSRIGARNFSGILAHVLRDLGHDVIVGKPWIGGDLDYYDHFDLFLVGLGPLKGLGTAYKYGALRILSTYKEMCVPFFDDLDVRKIHREFVTCYEKPQELFKEFWRYKADWSIVDSDPDLRKRILSILPTLIRGKAYGAALAPGWNRDAVFRSVVKMNRRWADITLPVDGSRVALPVDYLDRTVDPGAREVWVTGWKTDSKPVKRSGVHAWPIERLSRVSWDGMTTASGVLVPAPGWVPDVAGAVGMGVPVAGAWKTLSAELGASFEALPYAVEAMSRDERHAHAAAQREDFLRNCTEIDHLRDTIESVI